MAAPKTNVKRHSGKLSREKHLTEVSRLRMLGLTQWEIAESTNRSQSQISKDLRTVEKRWLEEQTGHMDTIKARIGATLERLASEAYQSWTAGKDPRHFANALAAVRDLRALIGTDAPRKTAQEVSGSLEVRHVDELDDSDLDKIARGEFTIDGEHARVGSKTVALPSLVA